MPAIGDNRRQSGIAPMHCPHCTYENATTANFCQECGQRLSLRCAACGFVIPQLAKFCPECGQPLTGAALPADLSPRFIAPQNYTPKHLAEKILTSRSALQ